MQKVIAALRANGGKDVTTQTVSLSTRVRRTTASRTASSPRTSPRPRPPWTGAGALIDAAVAAGANTIYGPSLSRSDADALYRQALAKAVDDAKAPRGDPREGRGPRRSAGVTAIAESGSPPECPSYAKASAAQDSTPVVSGPQETTASVSVTYELHLRRACGRGLGHEAPAPERAAQPVAGAGAARRGGTASCGGVTTPCAVVLRAVAARNRDVELGVAPHAVLGHVEPDALDLGLRADPDGHLHQPRGRGTRR